MNKYLISLTVCIFFVSSCASVEVTTNNVENEKESPFEIDENQKFLDFLEADWEKTLTNNPLFATYTGDKRFNDKINLYIISDLISVVEFRVFMKQEIDWYINLKKTITIG